MTETKKHNLRSLNKLVKNNAKTEITRKGKTYFILHICNNGVPVAMFYSNDPKDIAKEIEIREY